MTNGWNTFALLTPPRDPARTKAALTGGVDSAPCWWAAGCSLQLPQPCTKCILKGRRKRSSVFMVGSRKTVDSISFVCFETEKVFHGCFSPALGGSLLRIAA